jgi:hypothetical protein
MPNNILHQIDQLIFNGYKEKITPSQIELIEGDPKASCRKAKIIYSGYIIIYKFDKVIKSREDIFPFMNDLPRAKSICDFIIFYIKEDNLYCIGCNMKSRNPHNNKDQLDAGVILGQFITKTAQRFLNDDQKIFMRQLLFSTIPLYKAPTNSRLFPHVKIYNYTSNDQVTGKCDLDAICHPK